MHLSSGQSVELFVESKTTSEVTHTQYQQDVGEDTSDHTGLNDIDITLDQCDDGNQQLNNVTEWSDSDKRQQE